MAELLRWLQLRWRSLFRPHLKEAELNRELQFHLDQLIEENSASRSPEGVWRRGSVCRIHP